MPDTQEEMDPILGTQTGDNETQVSPKELVPPPDTQEYPAEMDPILGTQKDPRDFVVEFSDEWPDNPGYEEVVPVTMCRDDQAQRWKKGGLWTKGGGRNS